MNEQKKANSALAIILMLFFIIVIPFLPLLISQKLDWLEAWVYGLLCIVLFIISRILVARKNPDLLKERSQFMRQETARSWDKVLAPLVGLGSGVILLVAGFDHLYGWSHGFRPLTKIISMVFIMGGYLLGTWALVVNRYFSGMVRIQSERGHKVISSGPYRWMRHPGYISTIFTYLATPFWLDSSWAIVPALAIISLLVLRTYLEDKFLSGELDGYKDYSRKVRYRLLPGIW